MKFSAIDPGNVKATDGGKLLANELELLLLSFTSSVDEASSTTVYVGMSRDHAKESPTS